jgi:hypothetical protein
MRVSIEEAKKYRNRIQKRIFETLETTKSGNVLKISENKQEAQRWQNIKLDRIIAEYLLQKELSDGAHKLMIERNLEVSLITFLNFSNRLVILGKRKL